MTDGHLAGCPCPTAANVLVTTTAANAFTTANAIAANAFTTVNAVAANGLTTTVNALTTSATNQVISQPSWTPLVTP